MRALEKMVMLTLLAGMPMAAPGWAADPVTKPTIVLVHGAFAESSSWNSVIGVLSRDGYATIAAANPLRSVAGDARSVASLVRSIDGPVVLVGHSYGGPVISEAANGISSVKALVYVAAFAPEKGESSLSLSNKFPGSTLTGALKTANLSDGNQDLYIRPDMFRDQFAADVPEDLTRLMAITQRPVSKAALAEPSGAPAWKSLPSYAIFGTADRNIPPAVMRFMAERSRAVKTEIIDGASHALMVSHPEEVAALIEEAASAN